MKSLTYKFSAYLVAIFLGASFYYTLFQLFVFSPGIGLAIISFMILIASFLFLESNDDDVQEKLVEVNKNLAELQEA